LLADVDEDGGDDLLAIGYWLLAIGYWLLVIGQDQIKASAGVGSRAEGAARGK